MRKTGVHRENQWEVEQSRGYQIRRRRGSSKVGRYSWKLWRDPFLRGTVGSVLGTDRALGISVQSLALSRTNWCSRFQKAAQILYFPNNVKLLQSRGRVFLTPCIWLHHVTCLVIQAEVWQALSTVSCLLRVCRTLRPPRAQPDHWPNCRIRDCETQQVTSDVWVTPGRLVVEVPSSAHPNCLPTDFWAEEMIAIVSTKFGSGLL